MCSRVCVCVCVAWQREEQFERARTTMSVFVWYRRGRKKTRTNSEWRASGKRYFRARHEPRPAPRPSYRAGAETFGRQGHFRFPPANANRRVCVRSATRGNIRILRITMLRRTCCRRTLSRRHRYCMYFIMISQSILAVCSCFIIEGRNQW